MQTCLEKRGIPARASALTRNDYNIHDQYSVSHPDALNTGVLDPLGKGTGYGGHTHSVPDCNLPTSMISYANFDTDGGGGLYDIKGGYNGKNGGREWLMAISVYNKENQYGSNLVDTSLNVADGQIVV